MKTTVAREISTLLQASANCAKRGNVDWQEKHEERLGRLLRNYAPSGSGIDNGTRLCRDRSTPECLVFVTSFHHMDDNGMYDEWTDHTVTISASLAFGLETKISGSNRNDILEYLHEVFRQAMNAEIDSAF